MKYKANWIKTKNGNGIKTGNTITVKVIDAITVSGWIARKTWHGKKIMQIGQGKSLVSFKLKEKKGKKTVPYKTGTYILKISGTAINNKSTTWTDEFEVI